MPQVSDRQCRRLSVGLEIDATDKPVAFQKREHIVPPNTLLCRNKHFDTVLKSEQPLQTDAIPDGWIEGVEDAQP